jgi:hypothetical protein
LAFDGFSSKVTRNQRGIDQGLGLCPLYSTAFQSFQS